MQTDQTQNANFKQIISYCMKWWICRSYNRKDAKQRKLNIESKKEALNPFQKALCLFHKIYLLIVLPKDQKYSGGPLYKQQGGCV